MAIKRRGYKTKYASITLDAEQERAVCEEQIDYYSKKLYYLDEERQIIKARQHLDHWVRRLKALERKAA